MEWLMISGGALLVESSFSVLLTTSLSLAFSNSRLMVLCVMTSFRCLKNKR